MKGFAPCVFIATALLPALTCRAAVQTTINPTADSYVQGGNKANKNFGIARTLKARTDATAAKNFDSYLKFDTTTVPVFSAAKLRLYASLSKTGTVGTTLYAVSSTSWSETTITWNNKPALGAALASGAITSKTLSWYEFDVTGYLLAERAAGRNVISLALHAPVASSLTVDVKSRQANANKPQLVFAMNAAPAVSLTSPTNGASYAAGDPIPLSASAADSDGTITKVEFFAGTNLIGTRTQAPYTFDWISAPSGSHAFSAKATDDLGAVTTSSPVTVTVTARAALYFIHPDHLNSPRVITNQAQQVVWRWDNDDPFGANMANQNPSGLGNFTCNLRFPWQYFDRETSNHYNYFRDYSPEIGRYIQSDPIGLSGGINPYLYADANPISKNDPLGLATYMCTRRLSNVPFRAGQLYHQYTCVGNAHGGFTCGGLGPTTSNIFDSPGTIESDKMKPQSCQIVQDDNDCVEQCIKNTFTQPPPNYSVDLSRGENCQTYANAAVTNCVARCKTRRK